MGETGNSTNRISKVGPVSEESEKSEKSEKPVNRDKVEALVKEIHGISKVIHDAILEEPTKDGQEQLIQVVLVAATDLVDVAIDTAQAKEIEFSFMGRDLWYPAKGKKGTLEPREEQWDSSSDCSYMDDDEDVT